MPFRASTEKVRGSKTTGSDGTRRWRRRKKAHIDFWTPFRPVLVAFFWLFSKKLKQAILFCDFLGEKCVDRKNGVHHDEERGKTKKIAVSDFSFSKLCHRDFRKTFYEIFAILEFFNFFKKVKISENVSQKSLWQNFENEKSETAIFFIFPRCSSWCTPFFRSTHFSPRKTQNKMVCFEFFQKNENLWKCFAKISVTKFRK